MSIENFIFTCYYLFYIIINYETDKIINIYIKSLKTLNYYVYNLIDANTSNQLFLFIYNHLNKSKQSLLYFYIDITKFKGY